MFTLLQNFILYFNLALIFLLFSSNSLAKSKQNEGVISSFEYLLNNHKRELMGLFNSARKDSKALSLSKKYTDYKLHPLFMRSVLLYSDQKYLELVKDNECVFYSLLENDLLKTAIGPVVSILIVFKTQENDEKVTVITKKQFLNNLYEKKCFANKERATLYSFANIIETLKKQSFVAPKTFQECDKTLKSWHSNLLTPSICKIHNTIEMSGPSSNILKMASLRRTSPTMIFHRNIVRLSNRLKNEIPPFKLIFIQNLCSNLNDLGQFCSTYLATDVWKKVINSERPHYLMDFKCKNMMGIPYSSKISKNQLIKCREKLLNNPALCISKGNHNFPSLLPMPNCQTLSKFFSVSNLRTNYHDCPGNMENEGITNIHRIIMHLEQKKILSTPESCYHEANASFAKLNMDFKKETNIANVWPLKICYQDVILQEEVCKPYIPGHSLEGEYSESNIIAEIIERLKNTPAPIKCQFVDSKRYNPVLLQFKSGCFIVYDKDQCSTLQCPKKVYYNRKEFKKLKYIGVPAFDYYPTDHINQKYSLINIITESYKLKNKRILNLTELVRFLDSSSEHIIHGVGCAEQLLPHFFKETALNACRPLPFIIDGYIKKNQNAFLSTRTAIDDLHSPRSVSWHNVFSAIKNYQPLHPLNTWTLNGIQKYKY